MGQFKTSLLFGGQGNGNHFAILRVMTWDLGNLVGKWSTAQKEWISYSLSTVLENYWSTNRISIYVFATSQNWIMENEIIFDS